MYLFTSGGELKLLTDKIAFPNGIALSPDEETLYVAESGPNTKIYAFNVQDNGTIGEGRVVAAIHSQEGVRGRESKKWRNG